MNITNVWRIIMWRWSVFLFACVLMIVLSSHFRLHLKSARSSFPQMSGQSSDGIATCFKYKSKTTLKSKQWNCSWFWCSNQLESCYCQETDAPEGKGRNILTSLAHLFTCFEDFLGRIWLDNTLLFLNRTLYSLTTIKTSAATDN